MPRNDLQRVIDEFQEIQQGLGPFVNNEPATPSQLALNRAYLVAKKAYEYFYRDPEFIKSVDKRFSNFAPGYAADRLQKIFSLRRESTLILDVQECQFLSSLLRAYAFQTAEIATLKESKSLLNEPVSKADVDEMRSRLISWGYHVSDRDQHKEMELEREIEKLQGQLREYRDQPPPWKLNEKQVDRLKRIADNLPHLMTGYINTENIDLQALADDGLWMAGMIAMATQCFEDKTELRWMKKDGNQT